MLQIREKIDIWWKLLVTNWPSNRLYKVHLQLLTYFIVFSTWQTSPDSSWSSQSKVLYKIYDFWSYFATLRPFKQISIISISFFCWKEKNPIDIWFILTQFEELLNRMIVEDILPHSKCFYWYIFSEAPISLFSYSSYAQQSNDIPNKKCSKVLT